MLKESEIVEMDKYVIKYIGVANIAKLSWCQQYFKYTAVVDEKMFESQYKRLLKENDGARIYPAYKHQGNPGKVIKYQDIKNLNMFEFLKAFDYSIFTGRCKEKDKMGGIPVMASSDEFYLKKGYKKLIKESEEYVRSVFEPTYQNWLNRLLKEKISAIYIEDFWWQVPWRDYNNTYRNKSINPHILLGQEYERVKAESYSTIKKYFKYKKYILIAVPDGVTESFCYEFKSVKNEFIFYFTKSVARAQAILYSYFFNKPEIRYQIHIQKQDEIKTFQEKVNTAEAESILSTMDKLLKNRVKPIPPKRFKCSTCEFNGRCDLMKKAT